MKKYINIVNIFLALILIFVLFGCNGVEVTQEKKEIEAGNKSIKPVELINVKNSKKYKISVVSNEIDTSSLGSYTVEYSIINKDTDKEYIKEFEFDVVDTTPPEIIFTEGDEITVPHDEKFNPLDYIKVKDNLDKDISKKSVNVENSVDTSEKGVYFVDYSIKDDAGNKGTASLQVEVTSPVYEIGETFSINKYDITFNSYKFSSVDSEPQTGYYSYYDANEGQIFLLCNVTIKNKHNEKRDPFETFGNEEDSLKAELLYDDEYIYDTSPHSMLNNNWYYTSFISPLSTQTKRLTFEVPVEVKKSGKDLIVKIYSFSSQNDDVLVKIE